MSVGKTIKRLRTVTGLRQKAFAELLGVPQSQVSDWEHDRFAVLDISSLIKLAKALHCSVDELLAGVDPDYDRIRDGGAVGAVPARARRRVCAPRTCQYPPSATAPGNLPGTHRVKRPGRRAATQRVTTAQETGGGAT